MLVREAIERKILNATVKLTDAQLLRVKTLARAAQICKDDEVLHVALRERMRDVYREQFHHERPTAFHHRQPFAHQWEDLKQYFPYRYHPSYFWSSRFGVTTNEFLRQCYRTFQNVEIRGCGGDTDFIVIGYVPHQQRPTILGRIFNDDRLMPSVQDICEIMSARRSQWRANWPITIATTIAAFIGIFLTARISHHSGPDPAQIIVPLCALIGLGVGLLSTYAVNRIKRSAFTSKYPRLASVL